MDEQQQQQQDREEEEEIPIQPPRPRTPVPPQTAENDRHIWHLYHKAAELEQRILQKPDAEEVTSSVKNVEEVKLSVRDIEERIQELEDRLEETEDRLSETADRLSETTVRLEESERRESSLQEEVDELVNENEDLRRDLSPVERASSDELEKLWREELERRQDTEKSLYEALTALKPISKQNPWRVYVKLVLDPDQKTPASSDSHEHTRSKTLGCYRHVMVEGGGALSFRNALSLSFPAALLVKQWVPLIAIQDEDGQIKLERASDLEPFPSLWSVEFLRNTCALTINGENELYIAPQTGSLALDELESPRESPGLTEASTISSNSVLRRSNRKRSININNNMDTPVVMKRVRVKS